jgi:DNA-binding protein HU-beta
MTKKELIAELAAEMHFSNAQAERIVNKLLGIIQAEIKAGHDVKISGFGTFYRGRKAATHAANPQTGEIMEIAEQIIPKFRAGTAFKRTIK